MELATGGIAYYEVDQQGDARKTRPAAEAPEPPFHHPAQERPGLTAACGDIEDQAGDLPGWACDCIRRAQAVLPGLLAKAGEQVLLLTENLHGAQHGVANGGGELRFQQGQEVEADTVAQIVALCVGGIDAPR